MGRKQRTNEEFASAFNLLQQNQVRLESNHIKCELGVKVAQKNLEPCSSTFSNDYLDLIARLMYITIKEFILQPGVAPSNNMVILAQ